MGILSKRDSETDYLFSSPPLKLPRSIVNYFSLMKTSETEEKRRKTAGCS